MGRGVSGGSVNVCAACLLVTRPLEGERRRRGQVRVIISGAQIRGAGS